MDEYSQVVRIESILLFTILSLQILEKKKITGILIIKEGNKISTRVESISELES